MSEEKPPTLDDPRDELANTSWWTQALDHTDVDLFDLNSISSRVPEAIAVSESSNIVNTITNLTVRPLPIDSSLLQENSDGLHVVDFNAEDNMLFRSKSSLREECDRSVDDSVPGVEAVNQQAEEDKDNLFSQKDFNTSGISLPNVEQQCSNVIDDVPQIVTLNDSIEHGLQTNVLEQPQEGIPSETSADLLDSVPSDEDHKPIDEEDKDDSASDLDDLLLRLPVPPSNLPCQDYGSDSEYEEEMGNVSHSSPEEEQTNRKEWSPGDEDHRSELDELNKLLDPRATLTLCSLPLLNEPQTPEKSDTHAESTDPTSPWSVKFPSVLPQTPYVDHTHPGAYIEQASRLITKAIELESQLEYHDAFDLLKAGVNLLLDGVKVDTDKSRRDTVRRKLEGYLKHAEELHDKHLSSSHEDTDAQDPVKLDIQVPQAHSIKDFRVCRVEGNVVIVESLLSARKFAIKALYRAPSYTSKGKSKLIKVKNLTPDCIPYMVKLYQYFEAHSGCVFLMLEYIQGGCLVDFVHVNRHHWGHPPPPYPEASPVQPHGSDSSLKGTEKGSVDLIHKISIASSVDCDSHFRPPLVIDPPTPTLATPTTPEQSLPEVDLSEGVLAASCEHNIETGARLHYTPSSRTGSRQASPSASPVAPRTSILERKVKVWIAQIIIALENLHTHGIMCGDLNTRNILITQDGEARLTFFGLWQGIDKRSDPFLYEKQFVAPELCVLFKPNPASDFWSLGVILFELLCGRSFASCHPGGLHTHLPLSIPNPEHLSPEAQSILRKLLQVSSKERLGAGVAVIEEIKSDSFFRTVDWEGLQQRPCTPDPKTFSSQCSTTC